MTENDPPAATAARPADRDHEARNRTARQAASVREPAAPLPPGKWRIPTCPPEV